MLAQLSSAPLSLTGIRQDLPAAVDGIMARALSKAPGDRYGTCLEFATALRQACGVRTGSTAPDLTEWWSYLNDLRERFPLGLL